MSDDRNETTHSNADSHDRGFQPIGKFHKMGAARFGMGVAGSGAVGR